MAILLSWTSGFVSRPGGSQMPRSPGRRHRSTVGESCGPSARGRPISAALTLVSNGGDAPGCDLHDEVQDLDLDVDLFTGSMGRRDDQPRAIYQASTSTPGAARASVRTGRKRKPRRRPQERRGKIPDMPSIVERPDEAWGRAVPGWGGDLIMGADNATAIGTLVGAVAPSNCCTYPMATARAGPATR